jgi:hypothetical protein
VVGGSVLRFHFGVKGSALDFEGNFGDGRYRDVRRTDAFEEWFMMNRREFMLTSSAFAAVTKIFGADAESNSRYRIGYTSNTRGGWEKDPFVGFREAHEVGFNWIEHFASSLDAFYPDQAPELKKRLDEIDVGVCAITGGRRGGNTHFEDPASRHEVI